MFCCYRAPPRSASPTIPGIDAPIAQPEPAEVPLGAHRVKPVERVFAPDFANDQMVEDKAPAAARARSRPSCEADPNTLDPAGEVKILAFLGSGDHSMVYDALFAVSHIVPDGGAAIDAACVFKPLLSGASSNEEYASEAYAYKYCEAFRTARNNIVTYELSERLCFRVIVHTEAGLASPPGEPFQLGIVMERAEGECAFQSSLLDHREGIRLTMMLQLLDHVTGQYDRTGYNYHIHRNQDNLVTVKGIDNDACLEGVMHNPEDAYRRGGGVRLPPMIDTYMAAIFNGMTDEELADFESQFIVDAAQRQAMRTGFSEQEFCAMLAYWDVSEAEIEAAKDRLAAIKEHIHKLTQIGHVIRPDNWHRCEAVFAPEYANRSYVARDRRPVRT